MDIENLTTFDEIFSRFPHLSQAIFKDVDNISLTNCRIVSEEWKNVIDYEKSYWLRRIQKFRGKFEPFFDQWNKVIKKTPTEEIKELCFSVENFFKPGSRNMMSDHYSPLHLAAEIGLIDLSSRIIKVTDFANNNFYLPNLTPLHLPSAKGHREVCRLILEYLASKNPVAVDGLTPLHCAAMRGHSEIVKLLVQNCENIRPLYDGKTPIEHAAYHGHLKTGRLLMKNWQDVKQYFWAPRFQDPNRVFVPYCVNQ